jgi:hypothetical protein
MFEHDLFLIANRKNLGDRPWSTTGSSARVIANESQGQYSSGWVLVRGGRWTVADDSDPAFENGRRAGVARILNLCLLELGYRDFSSERLQAEREAAIAMLRRACDRYGDNEWDPWMPLAEIIEKHLLRHLEERQSGQEG